MAKYRSILTRVWKDPDFENYTPDQKLVFLYLCTNDSATESGLYPLSQKTVSNETGIRCLTVGKLLANGFKNVSYDSENSCVFVRNFLRYNGGGRPELIERAIRRDNLTIQTPLWGLFAGEYPQYADGLITYEQEKERTKERESSSSISSSISNEGLANGLTTVGNPLPTLNYRRDAETILSFLNEKTGKAFRPVPVNIDLITARLKSGVTIQQCKSLIAKKVRDWNGDPKMAHYLRPATLFGREKFEQYIGELVIPKETKI
jgi:uncharacterized phage protein (TIGR02220 family)